jgi:S-adenosylmethionine:tRNA ribosyltransferase-isomerase
MRLEQFDFDLPEQFIALRPAVPRDSARLLVVREDGSREHRVVRDLPELFRAGDILVLNDSKVIPARLRGLRYRSQGELESRAKIELLLHRRLAPDLFRALARPAKKLQAGDLVAFGRLRGRVQHRDGAEVEVAFELQGGDLDAAIALEGEVPLPPYIAGRRAPDTRDRSDYQTVYARVSGSVAAPTAGLHFTPGLLERLRAHGTDFATVTLHVGAGTFLPVSVEDSSDHVMHAEWAHVPQAVADKVNCARAAGARIVAVGSTALRTLETASDDDGRIHAFTGETDLFITPGYRFKAVDVLLTNFHLPRSTLFMLVSAFCGTAVMKAAYSDAIDTGYRFYSYGDACLLFRATIP